MTGIRKEEIVEDKKELLMMYYAQKHKELTGLSSSLQSEIPQLYFDVDRDKVKMLGGLLPAEGGELLIC